MPGGVLHLWLVGTFSAAAVMFSTSVGAQSPAFASRTDVQAPDQSDNGRFARGGGSNGLGCRDGESNDGDITVCGRRSDRYRIDPKILAINRLAESQRGSGIDDATSATSCGIGLERCGSDIIPVSAIAFVIAHATVRAAKGEDWRDTFRSSPNEYQIYRSANDQDGK